MPLLPRHRDRRGGWSLPKPIALDLCTGKGGWARGLKAAGWYVIGVDVKAWDNPYVDEFVQKDVRLLKGSDFPGVQLVCASPPCQEFSYRSFPFKRCRELRDTVPPDKSIWEACVRIAKEAGATLILENVRGAQGLTKGIPHPEWFMGKAAWNYGPFYFWGDRPLLLNPGKAPQKGFGRVAVGKVDPKDGKAWQGNMQGYQSRGNKGPLNAKRAAKELHGGFAGEMDRVEKVYKGKRIAGSEKYRRIHGAEQAGHHGTNARAEWSAKAAMIPEELSEWIGRVFHPDGI